MTDVTITPPPQSLGMGTQPVIIKAQPDSRFILAFPVDQAIIERPEDSDSLVFTFSDGSMVEIEGFYEQYTKDNLPEFEIEGQSIAGVDFFEAFAPDIEPAAGVGVSAKGGRYTNYGDADLMNGLRHLGDLDENFALSYPDQVQTLDPVPFTVATAAYGSGAATFPVAPTAPPPPVSTVPDAPYVPPVTPPVTPPDPPQPPAPPLDERFIVSRDGAPSTVGDVLHNDGLVDKAAATITGIKDGNGNPLVPNANGEYETQYGYVKIVDKNLVYTAKPGVTKDDTETFIYTAVDGNGTAYEKEVEVRFTDDANTYDRHEDNNDSYYSQETNAGNSVPGKLITGGGDDHVAIKADQSGGMDNLTAISGDATIETGGGDDIVTIGEEKTYAESGHLLGETAVRDGNVTIATGAGNDTVRVIGHGAYAATSTGGGRYLASGDILSGSTLDINTGDGDDTVLIKSSAANGYYYDASTYFGGTLRDSARIVNSTLHIDTGKGADNIEIAADLVNSSVDIKTGAGDDKVKMSTTHNSTLNYGGDVRIDTGEGNDEVILSAVSNSTLNYGDMRIDTGEGNDEVILSAGEVINKGDMNISTGLGDDRVVLSAHSSGGAEVVNAGTMSIDTGEGNDDVAISGTYINRGDMNISTGLGDDRVALSSSGYISGGGVVSIDTGEGNDEVVLSAVSNSIAGGSIGGGTVEVNTGAGDDIVRVSSAGTIEGHVLVSTGDGDDTVDIHAIRVGGWASAGSLDIDGGAGNDTIVVKADNASDTNTYTTLKAVIDGGEGNDFIDADLKLSGGNNTSTISGGEGNDVIVFRKDANQTIYGGESNGTDSELDLLIVSDSNDYSGSVDSLFSNSSINGIEAIVDTRNANGLTNLADIGVSFTQDGKLNLADKNGWDWNPAGVSNGNGKTTYTANNGSEQVTVTVDDNALTNLGKEVELTS